MIPKVIHYIWLGKHPKDRVSEICINTWKIKLSDYEIKEWNEDNLDINKIAEENAFFRECKKRKLWAFMSDYLRLMILYKEGGIYLDTDVQVLKSFTPLLEEKAFLSYESSGNIGTGIIGAEKNNPLISKLLDFYDNEIWSMDIYINPMIFSYVMGKFDSESLPYVIFPQEYFSPLDINYRVKDKMVGTENTYTIHWYNANWGLTRKGYVFLRTKQYKGARKTIEIFRKNIGYLLRKLELKKF